MGATDILATAEPFWLGDHAVQKRNCLGRMASVGTMTGIRSGHLDRQYQKSTGVFRSNEFLEHC